MRKEKTRESAMAWVKAGKLCKYRHGLAFRGAVAGTISNDEAMKMLQISWERNGKLYYKWTFGMGFYELCWEENYETKEEYLMFNEYGENDLY